MSVLTNLAAELNDECTARSWVRELIACHTEVVADSNKLGGKVYPFFTFLCLNGLTLLAIYHSESNIMLVALDIPDQKMIELGHQMAMSDVPQMEEFLAANSQLIRFGESISLSALGDYAN